MKYPRPVEWNWIAQGTTLQGIIRLSQQTLVHGVLKGEISAEPGGAIYLAESASVEGTLLADWIVVEGSVQGEITALHQLRLTATARVTGRIHARTLIIEPGAFFDGSGAVVARATCPSTVAPKPPPASNTHPHLREMGSIPDSVQNAPIHCVETGSQEEQTPSTPNLSSPHTL